MVDLGGVLAHTPLQDPIFSFSHTFSLKSAHIGGQNPPKWVHTPMENPGSGPEWYYVHILLLREMKIKTINEIAAENMFGAQNIN